jgi:hypothetical protein
MAVTSTLKLLPKEFSSSVLPIGFTSPKYFLAVSSVSIILLGFSSA